MDEIKTNISKIFEQFSEADTVNTISKRLSFDCLDESFLSSPNPKRRKDSLDLESNPTKKNKNEATDSNISINSSSTISSPWEARRTKADLIEAKSRITQLKQELKHQNTVKIKTELLYTTKVDSLQKQVDYSTSKIVDLEKHLSTIRKREGTVREELNKVKNQLNVQKVSFEERLHELQKINSELNEEFQDTQNELQKTINSLQRKNAELNENLKMAQEESDTLQNINFSLQDKADSHDMLEKELEIEKQKLGAAISQVKDLEYEIASYEEWKDMSKASLTRLTNMSELEKEVVRLRQETKNLRDSVGNKLILEEQVFDLSTRLEKYEKNNTDFVAIKVQLSTIEQELKEWKSVAYDHCNPNTHITPMCLRSRLEQLLQKDLILSSEKTNAKSLKKNMSEQLQESKTQIDIYTKSNADLKIILKRHQNIIHKIQKKLLIVAGERDCFKRLLDNYEKDLTITAAVSQNSPESQLRMRIDMLEKTVSGYKEMCANLEKEIQSSKDFPEINIDTINNDNYEKLRKELEVIRIENERLKRRKDELELELEHRSLRGDFNVNKFKVLHFSSNPTDEAHEKYKNEVEKLQVEIEKLKRRNRKLEEREQEMTMKFNESNITINVQEVNNLRTQLQSLESKNQHLKEIYKAASQEFREVCYMLFGYRVDRTVNTNYRISSMYAENEDDYLNFRLNESGVLDMLETGYSSSLADMMRNHLVTHNSLPAFLSALTLELFNRSTVTN